MPLCVCRSDRGDTKKSWTLPAGGDRWVHVDCGLPGVERGADARVPSPVRPAALVARVVEDADW